MQRNWASCQATGESCAFNLTAGLHPPGDCQQGAVPGKYVQVQSVEDVQRTVEFARRHRLRLVVKNTGHDYRGHSSAPDALALWCVILFFLISFPLSQEENMVLIGQDTQVPASHSARPLLYS